MEKNKILKYFKNEKEDEGDIYIENISSRYGFNAMLILTITLMLYQKIKNEPTGNVTAIMFSFLGFSNLNRYKYTKKNIDIINGVFYLFLALIFLALYVVETW